MRDKKTLKTLTIISLAYAMFEAIRWFVAYFQIKFTTDNPLIPDALINYVRFPIYFLFPIFIILAIVSYYLIRNNLDKPKIVWLIFGILVLYFFFGGFLYQFIQSFNPYGT